MTIAAKPGRVTIEHVVEAALLLNICSSSLILSARLLLPKLSHIFLVCGFRRRRIMKLMHAFVGLAALGGMAISAVPASAMPISIATSPDIASNVEQVAWVCGPFRCWWRPN